MAGRAELRTAGRLQAWLCRENGSPTYAAIIDAMVSELDGTEPSAPEPSAPVKLLLADSRPAGPSAVYLRLLAAVHRLVLADPTSPLRRLYPSVGGTADPVEAVDVFFDVVAHHAAQLAKDMVTDMQTNDVGRAAPLSAGLNWVVDSLGGPVRLLEIGASAGLNLWMDRYRVVADGTAWGPEGSPVQLVGHFAQGAPPTPLFEVVGRDGCDLRPIDLSVPASRNLLRSFVWPERVERLARLEAAITAAGPVSVEVSDACSWLAERLASLPAGVTTVVFHSIVLPYLSADERARLTSTVRSAGAAADQSRRLAWLALEPSSGGVGLSAQVWPGNEKWLLATCTPHGLSIRWQPRLLRSGY